MNPPGRPSSESSRTASRPDDPPTAQRGLILSLASSDLRHEKVLNACLLLALTAVFAPLLILFGLKNGIVETMRDRLVEDPRNREIRPRTSQVFERAWLDTLQQHPEVAFVAPMTRQISTSVKARIAGQDNLIDLDLLATDPGDALVLENEATIPTPGECVLSASAAEKLGAVPGNEIEIEVARYLDGQRSAVTVVHRCIGITSPRATGLPVLFATLDTLEAVENYRDGRAVPELGWPGGIPEAQPMFDGALLALPGLLPREDELELVVSTGFSTIRLLPPDERPSSDLPPSAHLYLLTTIRSGIRKHLETLKGQTAADSSPAVTSTLGLLDAAIGDVESLVYRAEHDSAAAWVKIASNSGYFLARELRKMPKSERLLELVRKSGTPAEITRDETRHANLLMNIEDAANQYADALRELSKLDRDIVLETFATFQEKVTALNLEEQIKANDIIVNHVKDYFDTKRLDMEAYQRELQSL